MFVSFIILQCNSFGEKTRTVTCVWEATGKPVTKLDSISEDKFNQFTINAASKSIPVSSSSSMNDLLSRTGEEGEEGEDARTGNECNHSQRPAMIEHYTKTTPTSSLPSTSFSQMNHNEHQNGDERFKHKNHYDFQHNFQRFSNNDNRQAITLSDSSIV